MSHPYPQYRDSGVACLGELPEHWEVTRLDHIATYGTSSVDKKTEDGEVPVRLCNYTDVYYLDRIRAGVGNFMKATASLREIARFRLQAGDVLITKDSEDWQDIGVPALIDETANDFVCGYHLGIIRCRPQVDSAFMFRAMQSVAVNRQLQTSASGVTRYGLPNSAVVNVRFPLPPVEEQRAIAMFLDRETERIDGSVEKKRLLIERLEEYRTALITRTVTRGLPPEAARAAGLDPSPRLKHSGVEWLGDVPEHWDVLPLQRLLREALQYGANEAAELDDPSLPRFVRITDIDPAGRLRDDTFRSLPIDLAEPYILRSGDLLFARSGATVGRSFLYDESWGPCAYAGYLIRARVHPERAASKFISYFSATQSYASWLRAVQIQATIQNVSAERYSRLPIPVPPLAEQQAIVAFLDQETESVGKLVDRVERNIERLQEYRTALITAAVTGKIDVREAAQAPVAAGLA